MAVTTVLTREQMIERIGGSLAKTIKQMRKQNWICPRCQRRKHEQCQEDFKKGNPDALACTCDCALDAHKKPEKKVDPLPDEVVALFENSGKFQRWLGSLDPNALSKEYDGYPSFGILLQFVQENVSEPRRILNFILNYNDEGVVSYTESGTAEQRIKEVVVSSGRSWVYHWCMNRPGRLNNPTPYWKWHQFTEQFFSTFEEASDEDH